MSLNRPDQRSQKGSAALSDLRRVYPALPSARLADARKENAKNSRGNRRVPATTRSEPRDPFEGLKRRHKDDVNRSDPVSSGAHDFPRKDDLGHRVEGLSCANGRVLLPSMFHGYQQAAALTQDIPEAVLPPLDTAMLAAQADCIRAGRFQLASALSERVGHLGVEADQFHPTQMTRHAPASAHVVRAKHEMPRKLHSDASAVRPTHSTAQSWSACSSGARLMYAGTTVMRGDEKTLGIRDAGGPNRDVDDMDGKGNLENGALRHCDTWSHGQRASNGCSVRDEDSEYWRNAPQSMRLRQRWAQVFAVGPATSLQDRAPEGLYFETRVELVPEAFDFREHYGHRQCDTHDTKQRPLLHLGATCVAPEVDEDGCLDEPFSTGDQCWLISTHGHVHANGALTHTVPVEWPAAVQQSTPRVRLHTGYVLGVLMTELGGLKLYIDGVLAAVSANDVLPRSLSWGVGKLYPMIMLGPNVKRATLRALSTS